MSEVASLDRARILRLYVPLALSWIFMAIEAPICTRIITTLAQGELQKVWAGAFLALMSYSLFIESPVIDLLSTSTTLARSKASYSTLRRFVIAVMLLVTATHAFATVPFVFNAITANLSPAVREALHGPMMVMIPWSAFIGWRRFKQGILIRYGASRRVSVGTGIRVLVIAGVGFGLAALAPQLGGVMIAAIALVASVAAEALYIEFVTQPVLRERLFAEAIEPVSLTISQLVKFHGPLTLTTMVTLASGLLITQALSASPDALLAMAGWQVALTIVWLHRTVAFALPEVVITLYSDGPADRLLRRFCLEVGFALSLLMAISALTGLDRWLFQSVLSAQTSVAEVAHLAFMLCILLPVISAGQSYVRGVLTALHLTVSRLVAVLISVITLALGLFLGVRLGLAGVVTAAIAQTVSLLVESLFLARSLSKGKSASRA